MSGVGAAGCGLCRSSAWTIPHLALHTQIEVQGGSYLYKGCRMVCCDYKRMSFAEMYFLHLHILKQEWSLLLLWLPVDVWKLTVTFQIHLCLFLYSDSCFALQISCYISPLVGQSLAGKCQHVNEFLSVFWFNIYKLLGFVIRNKNRLIETHPCCLFTAFIQSDTILEVLHFGEGNLLQVFVLFSCLNLKQLFYLKKLQTVPILRKPA